MVKYAIPVLHVSSSVAAEAFYRRLGFEKQFAYRGDEARADPCYMGVSREGVWLHLSSFSGDGVAGNVVYVCVEEVDAIHAELSDKKIPVHLAPTNQTWGNREMYVKDLDGNTIRFTQHLGE